MFKTLRLQFARLLQASTLCALLLVPSAAFSQSAIDKIVENAGLNWGIGSFSSGTYLVSQSEQAAWERLYPFVAGLITDELVVSLSRYSLEATKKFHFQASTAGTLKVYGFTDEYVIFEADLADLPAAPAVVRKLKVFILSPNLDHQFLPNRIAITIRGERLE